MKNNTFMEIAQALKQGEVFLIFPHVVMDADALGSAGALALALRSLGKKADVIIEDDVPKYIKFLDENVCVHVDEIGEDYKCDVAICVDCNSKDRFPKRENIFNRANIKVCIDHHMTADVFYDYNYIDPQIGATAELIYELIKALEVEMTEDIAKRIFAGITSDTGNFQYSNTTKSAHITVAELYDICDSFNDVSNALYENVSFAQLKLQSKILDSVKIFADGQGIIAYIYQKDLEECGADMDETGGIITRMRKVEGVEVAVLLKEKDDGTIKVSLRAKTYMDVANVCQKFGGGGHIKAAGFTTDKPMNEIYNIIIKEIESAIDEANK